MLLHDGKQTGQIIHEQAQTVEFVNLDLSLPDTNDLLKWKQYCRNKKNVGQFQTLRVPNRLLEDNHGARTSHIWSTLQNAFSRISWIPRDLFMKFMNSKHDVHWFHELTSSKWLIIFMNFRKLAVKFVSKIENVQEISWTPEKILNENQESLKHYSWSLCYKSSNSKTFIHAITSWTPWK